MEFPHSLIEFPPRSDSPPTPRREPFTPNPAPAPPPLPIRLATLSDREVKHLRMQGSIVKSLIRESTQLIPLLSELKISSVNNGHLSAELKRVERQLETNMSREFQLHGYVESVDLIREQRRVRRLLQYGSEGTDKEFEARVRAITGSISSEMERFNKALNDSKLKLRGVPIFGMPRWNLEPGTPPQREGDRGAARD